MTQGVVAVATTGIYCRPAGCGARPRRENTRSYPTAAAAEAAGYRACLRCRPYRTPVSVPWTAPELVCRAVRLILSGALDDGREDDLAARLGVSGRHLRRLFIANLGVTPGGLARSARAHFARRLLDDTELTITEVAFAAGFGSLRQFNRACQDVFRASPRQLRDRRRRADRLVADGGLTLRLPFQGPLDWRAMTGLLAAEAIPGVENVSGDTYRRTILVDEDPGVLELLPGGDDHLILRAHLPHWDQLIHIVEQARQIASLDLDSREPVARLAPDAMIGRLVTDAPGLRPPGAWDAFEAGVRAIIGHDLSEPAANATVGRLVQHLGKPVGGLTQFGLHYVFPTPNAIAAADPERLEIPGTCVQAVRSFARAVVAGQVRLDRSMDLDQLVVAITAIEGIGPQTAHHIALRLGEPDAWPITTRTLDRMLLTENWPPTTTESGVAERWRPWRALAATHIWHAVGPELAAGSSSWCQA